MIVKSLELTNYRNYPSLKLELAEGTNLFYGDNAQGKTNLLEAVYACATTASHRSGKDREVIAFESGEAHVRLYAEKKGRIRRLDYHISRDRGKEAALDGKPLGKLSELLGQLHVVFFSPEDLRIIKSAPVDRRSFMNVELCQMSPLYTGRLIEYRRTLLQRNALLKSLRERKDMTALLDIYDQRLALAGEELIRERGEFLKELGSIASRIHRELTEDKEALNIEYRPGSPPGSLEEALRAGRERDIQSGSTQTGPQRDEIEFSLDGVDLKHFGSQGQQRTAALSLKLAEIELVENRIGDAPVLLLDDVLSELDGSRQEKLFKSIRRVQTLISCTGMEDFLKRGIDIDKKWKVCRGTLTEEKVHE